MVNNPRRIYSRRARAQDEIFDWIDLLSGISTDEPATDAGLVVKAATDSHGGGRRCKLDPSLKANPVSLKFRYFQYWYTGIIILV